MDKNGKIISKLFRGSVISIIAAAIAAMLGIVIDGVIIGRFLGKDSMAAYGLVTPVINLATACSGILATGAQVVCAQHLGAGNAKKARRAFSMCMVVTVILSAVLMIGIFFFREQICIFLGAKGNSAHLLKLSSDYLLGMLVSVPCVILLFEFNALMRLDGDANRVVVAVAVMTVLDIAGDIVNALVIKGGMLGMGITTSISYVAALLILLLHFFKKDIIFKFSLKGLKISDLKDILTTGSSSAVGSVSAMLTNSILNNIMVATALSSTALAALSVLNTVFNFTSSTMVGVGMTAAMIAGMILGEKDRTAAEHLVKVTLKSAIIIGAGLGILLFALADVIAGAFKGDGGEEMVKLAARGLRIYAISIPLYGINTAFINYTQGMRRMGYSNTYCFLQNFVFRVIPALLLCGSLQTDAVWFAYIITEVLTLIAVIGLAAFRKRGVPFKISDYLFLKEPFGASADDVFEVSIASKEQIVPASEAVGEFCRKKGAEDKQRVYMSLFVEELCNNILNFGFADNESHSVDIRVVHSDDGWTLRTRDNCKPFDPTEWIKLHENADRTANLGIRMVCGMAKEVKYTSTLQLNNLMINL